MTKQNMDRMLKEFPWLWAIRNAWAPHQCHIRVFNGTITEVSYADLPSDCHGRYRETWVYSDLDVFQRVTKLAIPAKQVEPLTLKEYILTTRELNAADTVRYIVIVTDKNYEHFSIFRLKPEKIETV